MKAMAVAPAGMESEMTRERMLATSLLTAIWAGYLRAHGHTREGAAEHKGEGKGEGDVYGEG